MSRLRSELSRRLGFSGGPLWQDGRSPQVDVQVYRPSGPPPQNEDVADLGQLDCAQGFWNFRFGQAALWSAVQHFLDSDPCFHAAAPQELAQRVHNLALLCEKLAPQYCQHGRQIPAAWLLEPLNAAERVLAVGLERLWACSEAQKKRRSSVLSSLNLRFNDYYQNYALAATPLKLCRAHWLGQALLTAKADYSEITW